MFNYLKTRIFLAGVMAEIKAQYGDQKFINNLISLADVCDFLSDFKSNSNYMNEKRKYYLASFGVLAAGSKSTEWTFEHRKIALMLLQERLVRASYGNFQFKYEEYFTTILTVIETSNE